MSRLSCGAHLPNYQTTLRQIAENHDCDAFVRACNPNKVLIFCYLHCLTFKVGLGAWKGTRNMYAQNSSNELSGNRPLRAGLANFNPLESHTIHKDCPDGPTYAHIHRKLGVGVGEAANWRLFVVQDIYCAESMYSLHKDKLQNCSLNQFE